MQRVRLGLTGLAFVFLTILIAIVALRSERMGTTNPQPQGETLAMLGVAPGAEQAPTSPTTHAAPAATAPAPAQN